MGEIITNLSPNGVFATTSQWLGPLFLEMLPWALVGLGIVVGGYILGWFIRKLWSGVKIALGKQTEDDEYHNSEL